MAGPFPGMDPYIEFESAWPDFHNRLIAEICNELGGRLPDSYVARVDERIEVATPGMELPQAFRPDVLIGRSDEPSSVASTAALTLVPELVELADRDPEEVRITWVEIRALPDLKLVTAVEVLSPINKSWQGRRTYLDKRDKLHASEVNLVEIDLLLNGAPLPMKRRVAPGLYYAIVARVSRLPLAEVYTWSVRDRLPNLPIPLCEPDPDVVIDLATLVERVYRLGRYDRTLHRSPALPEVTPLSAQDREWIEMQGGFRGETGS